MNGIRALLMLVQEVFHCFETVPHMPSESLDEGRHTNHKARNAAQTSSIVIVLVLRSAIFMCSACEIQKCDYIKYLVNRRKKEKRKKSK